MRNGETAPQIPASIRTTIIMGGGNWQVDEEVKDVVSLIEAFLLGGEQTLWLTADHRPIAFSRKLVESWATAWPLNRKQIQPVTQPEAVGQLTRR